MPKTCEDYRDQLTKLKPKVWATIIPTRSTKPPVSLHTSVSHAKNAVSATYSRRYDFDTGRGGYPLAESEVYELVDGEWVLRWEIADGTYPNDLPWKKK